jgi:hypothetical protein
MKVNKFNGLLFEEIHNLNRSYEEEKKKIILNLDRLKKKSLVKQSKLEQAGI